MERMAITGARLIDGTGGEPLAEATVMIEGTRIAAVGTNVSIPRGTRTISADNRTLMPGLIDAHVHNMGMTTTVPLAQRPRELGLIRAIRDATALLEAGYTTVRDCGCRNGVLLKRAVAEGSLDRVPRIVAAGLVVAQTFNGMDNPYRPESSLDARLGDESEFLLCDGVEECVRGTRYALRYGADFLKILGSGNYAFDSSPSAHVHFNSEELNAIVNTASNAGKKVGAHCHNRASARACLTAGVATIEHAIGVDEEVARLAIERQAIFVSSLTILRTDIEKARADGERLLAERYETYWEEMVAAYKAIKAAGARLATGSDLNGSPALPLGRNALELQLLVDHCGFTPSEAIVAATRNGAAACFLEGQIGTIECGKSADLILVDGDPLADIRVLREAEKIQLVMLEGRIEVNRGLAIARAD